MKIEIDIEPAKREEIARGLSCDLFTQRMQVHEKAACQVGLSATRSSGGRAGRVTCLWI